MSKNIFFAHESAYIDENCDIGTNTKIWHFSHIMKNSKIGNDCIIGQNVVVSPNVIIGNKVKIQNNVSVYTGVICEDGVFLGPSCVFTNVINPRAFIEKKDEYKETVIGIGATIGANSTIICGHNIGKFALIGAGSVITKNVSDYALVYGVPARQVGYVCECGEQIEFVNSKTQCKRCNKEYTNESNIVRRYVK